MAWKSLAVALCVVIVAGCGSVEWFPVKEKTDITPDFFTFAPKKDVTPGETVTSESVTIRNIRAGSAAISVAGDAGSKYSINNGSFTGSAGTVSNNDVVTLQHTASSSAGTTVRTVVTVGDYSAEFASTTKNLSLSPPNFAVKTNVELSQWVESEPMTITGAKSSYYLSLTNGYSRNDEFSVNNGPWLQGGGTVQSGQTIKIRHLSANGYAYTITTYLLLDNQQVASFSSTTRSQ